MGSCCAGNTTLKAKPFPLVQYFSLTALACMLAVAIFLGTFYQRQAMDSLFTLAENQNVTLTKTFSNFLWARFAPQVEASRGQAPVDLKANPEWPVLRQRVVDMMHDTGAVKVKVYNLDGVTVFSTDAKQIGENKAANAGFLGAARGEIKSELAHRDSFDAFEGVISDRNLFSSYLPIRGADGKVQAVFELYRDVTPLVEHMQRTEWMVVAGVALSMAALYGLLFLIVWRAKGIIHRQGTALATTLNQVREANRLLDQRVQERTAELSTVNAAMAVEIQVRRQAEEKFEFLAHHDPLTGLPNRMRLQERIDSAIGRAKENDSQFAVLFIDLDNFKAINDTLGHPTGDELLQLVTRELFQHVRAGDTLARLGGDEFILLADVKDKAHVEAIAQKILDVIHQPFHLADMELYLGATIGISLYPGDGEDRHTLIRNADTAMYRAKAGRRDQFQFYAPEMTSSAEERLRLDGLLRKALDNDELYLAYQPQIDLKSGELVGVEALLRWEHPTLGSIPPGRFIPVAEESGLICTLGAWVLREACSQMGKWMACGFEMPQVAVNVSPRQFEREGFVDRVRAVLRDTGIPAERLELEITETAIMLTRNADEVLRELREIGLRLSIDDFGTGYSSLNYLKQLPIQKLKIDRSFIQDMETNANDVAIIRSVIALAKTMGLSTVAEGVETPGQARFLTREGCDQVQGFLYSKPVPADELILRWAEKGQGKALGEISALYDTRPAA